MDWRTTDRHDAADSARDALHAIEALQSTDVWMALPLETQRQISRTHGVLGALLDGMIQEEVI